MIEFKKKNGNLILLYTSENGSEWVYEKLNNNEHINLKRTFILKKDDLYSVSSLQDLDFDIPVEFVIAHQEGDYFKFDKKILSIDYDLYINKDIKLPYRDFTAEKNVSIFSIINELKPGDIYIGGDKENSLPVEEFKSLIKNFPNTYELRKYVIARVSAIVRNCFDTKIDGEDKYHKYMNKKVSREGDDLVEMFKNNEVTKFIKILNKLEKMLKDENSYNERQWQAEILQIVLLLHPKYIHVFREVPIRDIYNNKKRSLDFLLVDSSGNVDIVEIKRPFDKSIVTSNQYRNNYIPLRELSGAVMQVEKYIFYLNKWGEQGEDFLTEKYRDALPDGFNIKITNPGGIIIMGRENNLSYEQRQDFEVIKRKNKNIIDIITYDDLLGRLRFTIEQLRKGHITNRFT